jgi:ring-1,2-phenylacetyl-CoA epoxidase subunit PaaA
MSDFGTDAERYQAQHDWSARVERDADIGAARKGSDMRLAVFHYPIESWIDAVVMNVLQGLATGIQMTELTRVSYTPLAEVFREIAPREARHAELGLEGLDRIASTPEGRQAAKAAVDYWKPRVATTFGIAGSSRFEMLRRFGLRHTPNERLLAQWEKSAGDKLGARWVGRA